jgi:hypothetical protein
MPATSTQAALNSADRPEADVTDEETELIEYLSLPLIPRTSDPMLWWADYVRQKDGLSKSPLAQLAAIFLAAPATSVASERVFSVAGDTGTATRNRMSPDHLDMLVFLRYNLPAIGFNY